MSKNIEDFSPEVLVLVFKYLSLKDIAENCSKTCKRWKEITAHFVISQPLFKLSNLDDDLKNELISHGWSIDHNDSDLILCLYEKFKYFKGKFYEHELFTIQLFSITNSIFRIFQPEFLLQLDCHMKMVVIMKS